MNRGIVLHTYIRTSSPIGKAVSFDQPPCLFLFHVQGFLVPGLVVTVWWLTVVVFLSDVWGFTWCCCCLLLLLPDVSVSVSGLSGYNLTFSRFCQAITLLLYLCTALYPVLHPSVLYPSVPVICVVCCLIWCAVSGLFLFWLLFILVLYPGPCALSCVVLCTALQT